ncbi:Clp protease N-terminal domain-containing protein [Kribbella monticola]|uniref:Clp protease N-terminal domain-containing protein n=1 Tax=Kribbella monticola TaxID=2185285 RepID=UPI000DD4D4AD|nr:Clp protease N-terminal domain-containing protein [Kribbella monticola]
MTTKLKDVRTLLVQNAREEAEMDGSAMIEAEHVLLSLASPIGGDAARLLAEAGLTRDAIRAALDQEWEQSLAVAGVTVTVAELPRATSERGRNPKFGESAKLVLKRAAERAKRLGASRMSPAHVLVGVLDTKLGRVPRTLELAGVDRTALYAKAIQLID